ncbi:hypothetical protein LUZ60_002591 [Juncus effusus]|nr:hypothetical protein LUZ60_002591 [Juncus effusus]
MEASSSFDTVVIGAGIMGSCTAYHLSKLNQKTLLLEQFDLLHQLGSSHGHSRTIRAAYAKPFYPPLVSLSYSLFLSAQAESGYTVLTPTTQLDLWPESNSGLQACIENLKEYELLNKEKLKEKFSGAFDLPDDGWTAVETPIGGVINATKAVAMFQSLAARNGTVFKDHVEATYIKKEENSIRVISANNEVFFAKKVIITAGAWTSKLVKSINGVELPIQPLHLLICYWKIKEGHECKLTPQQRFPTFSSHGDDHIFGTPSIEYPGLIKISLDRGPPCDPDNRNWELGSKSGSQRKENINSMIEPIVQWIDQFMSQYVETADGPLMSQGCMYSMTPDKDYIIDFLGGEFGKDVVVAGGFSGHGFKMGPVVGKILAEMAVEGEVSVPDGVDLGMFSIKRFEDNPNGNLRSSHAS